MIATFSVPTRGKGLHNITQQIADAVAKSGVREGLCTIFVQHTSASIVIQENADPAVLRDLENWLSRLVREDEPFEHAEEGPDDMPSHIRAALTATSVAIPIMDGKPALGTWQGIFLWEHRTRGRNRTCVVHVASD